MWYHDHSIVCIRKNGAWGAAAQSGGDAWRAIGGAKALKNSALLPLAFPRSTPILMHRSLKNTDTTDTTTNSHACDPAWGDTTWV
jgi:hypothetical protein|eukprot:COSAG06_NODE_8211_length_2237_cov_20.351263_2_plen_85_part_00